MQMEIGSMKVNDRVRVRYIGVDNPMALRTGKIYDARVLKLSWLGVVDESGEEYAYPPEVFEILEI